MPATVLGYRELIDVVTRATLDLADSGVATPIIFIDGRAGSGKSTLASMIQNELFRQGESLPRVIHMDDLYDGWEGLNSGVEYLVRFILTPLLSTGSAHWQEYDWAAKARRQWREFSGGTPLIVEGCGSLNQYTANISELSVWLEIDPEVRKKRWLEREPETFEKYFDLWAAQELDFIARTKSPNLAKYLLTAPFVDEPDPETGH